MSAINLVFNLLSVVIMVYMLLILIRILATWYSGASMPPIISFIGKITDPYLNLFRSWKFLRVQFIDLSPLVAIAILFILYYITNNIAISQSIWFGLVLYITIQVLGMTIQSVFIMFGLLAVIRLIGIIAKASSVQRAWYTLDHILQPLVYPFAARLSPHKVLPYGTSLGIFLALNIAAWVLCDFLFRLLAEMAYKLPF
jgi:YggT family protein